MAVDLSESVPEIPIGRGLAASTTAIAVNVSLALVKVTVGVIGNSYALIADGIESSADVISSLIVWGGLKVAVLPPDADHPYGHGKAEALAAFIVSGALLAAAALIAVQSVHEILTPHHAPAWFTLIILGIVIVIKEVLSRWVLRTAKSLDSTALQSDAWHHRSDAITSAAVFIGISIALIGGPGYESADDWSALVACAIIAYNGLRLLWSTGHELMDADVSREMKQAIAAVARAVPEVVNVEKCWVRKYGLGYIVDLHVEVDGDMSVREGHRIGHEVKDALRQSTLRIAEVLVHIEPATPVARPSPAPQPPVENR